MFDLNDCDETGQGLWEWDLKRLITSFVQVKEAEPPAVKTALGKKPLLANGERVVIGSWLMQSVSDPIPRPDSHARTHLLRA